MRPLVLAVLLVVGCGAEPLVTTGGDLAGSWSKVDGNVTTTLRFVDGGDFQEVTAWSTGGIQQHVGSWRTDAGRVSVNEGGISLMDAAYFVGPAGLTLDPGGSFARR